MMLTSYMVSETIGEIQPALEPTHPLMLWKVQFDAETPAARLRGRVQEYGPHKQALFEHAAAGRGDPYCDAIMLGHYAFEPGLMWIDEKDREARLGTFFQDLLKIVDSANEPVLEYWLADAAITRAEALRNGFAGELKMVACRLGCRLKKPILPVISLYIREFLAIGGPTVALGNYVASGVLAVVAHLRELTNGAYEPLFATLEMQSLAVRALFDADQGRREGVRLCGDMIHTLIDNSFHSRIAARLRQEELRSVDGWATDEELLGIEWDTSEFGGGLETLADAELLVGMPDRAFRSLKSSMVVSPYEGAENDLEVLRRVLQACYPERIFET